MSASSTNSTKAATSAADVKSDFVDHKVVDTEALTAEGEMNHIIDPVAEKKLVWKYDLRILPILAIMYLFNALDKSNLGNAYTAGLNRTLHLKSNQYNILLSVFYVPYVLTAPFLGIAGKKYGPSRVLPLMMGTFGFCTVMVTTAQNFSGWSSSFWSCDLRETC